MDEVAASWRHQRFVLGSFDEDILQAVLAPRAPTRATWLDNRILVLVEYGCADHTCLLRRLGSR